MLFPDRIARYNKIHMNLSILLFPDKFIKITILERYLIHVVDYNSSIERNIMISNSTGMDIFDRSFEPMCYCVNNDGTASFKETLIDAWNNVGNVSVISAPEIRKAISFSCWHIKRSDLLTLSPIEIRRHDGRRVEPLYYGGRV